MRFGFLFCVLSACVFWAIAVAFGDEFEPTGSQKPPIDVEHPGYDCILSPAKPAVDGGAYSKHAYKIERVKELGAYRQPDSVKKPRVIYETVAHNYDLLVFKNLSCSEQWSTVRVSLPTKVAAKPAADKLLFAAKILGGVRLTGSPSAKAARAIQQTLRKASKLDDLSALGSECDPEKDDHCFTVCLKRRGENCRTDVAVGINDRDLSASYVDRP